MVLGETLTKLISSRKETVTSHGYASGHASGPSYRGRGSHSGSSRYNNRGNYDNNRSDDVVYSPSTTTEFVILTVESVSYDLKTEERICSAELVTVVEKELEKMMTDYVEGVTKDLKEKGLI